MSPEAAEEIYLDCLKEVVWDYILEKRVKEIEKRNQDGRQGEGNTSGYNVR